MEIKVPQERMRKAPQERMRLASKTKRHGWVYHERRKETIMAKYRKLGRTSPQRKALLRNQVTALLYHGKIVTTEARAKEVRKIAEHLITLAIKERDNYETVTVTAKVPVKDKDGKRVKEVIDGKRVTKIRECGEGNQEGSPLQAAREASDSESAVSCGIRSHRGSGPQEEHQRGGFGGENVR